MEKVRKMSKRLYLRRIMACWLAFWVFFGLPVQVARATVSGGAFQVGTGTIVDGVDAATVLVNQMESVIHWDSLDTTSTQSLTFSQLSELSNSAVLNRVVDEGATIATFFDGALSAVDMRIFMVNPAGIVFGPHSSIINVNQLVASGLGMSNDAFHAVLEDVTNKMEFSDGSGDVTNQGTIEAIHSVYLVGRNVFNNGSIVCPDGLVVMATGDAVKLGQPGSAVIVDMANDFTVDTDNDLDNSGGTGIEAKNVVLAAGDIWSQTLIDTETFRAEAVGDIDIIDSDILATAVAASDAVATIDIIAGGHVTVDGGALVSAKATGSGIDNAIATTTINAGGDVMIEHGTVEAWAVTDDYYSLGAGDLTATVDIDAGQEVTVGSEDTGHIWAVATTGEYATGTYGDLTATVDIDAGKVNVDNGNIAAVAKTGFESYVDAGDITATVNIDAVGYSEVAGDVVVGGYHYGDFIGADLSTVEAHAEAGSGIAGSAGNVTATVNIDADGMLDVDEGEIQAEAMIGYQQLAQAGNLTATVDIATGSDVDVFNGSIRAMTYADNSPAVFGDSSATVAIDSGGYVEVTANDNDEAYIGAYAQDSENNTANTTVLADGYVKVQEDASFTAWSVAKIEANASDGQNNDADVVVDAGGDVQVIANHGAAEIRAEAEEGDNNNAKVEVLAAGGVEVRADSSSGITSSAMILAEATDGFNNTAETVVDAAGDVLVMATAGSNADAKLSAEAGNDIEINDEETIQVPGFTNNATVDVTASSVEVKAEDDAEAKLQAQAKNEIDIYNPYPVDVTIDDSLVNTAEAKIVTTGISEPEPVEGDVLVEALSSGEAWIGAEAGNDIRVHSESYDRVDISVSGSFENTAKVDITATDQVRVNATGNESEAWIYAEAYNEIGNDSDQTVGLTVNGNVQNQAGTLIDAGDDTTLEDSGIEDGGDDVEVRADDGSEAYIDAETWNYLYDLHEVGDTLNVTVNGFVENVATVDITTGDEVWVIANYYADDDSEAGIIAWAENEIETRWWDDGEQILYEGTVDLTVTGSVTNQADVVINSGDNVVVQADDDAEAYIAAWADNEIYAGEVYVDVYSSVVNSAVVDITTGDDVDVEAYYAGDAYIEAEANNNLEDESINTLDVAVGGSVRNTAGITITADEDVEVYAYDNSEAGIISEASNNIDDDGVNVSVAGTLENTATVDMEVAEDVEVQANYGSKADIFAGAANDYIYLRHGDVLENLVNTAKVDIAARSVEVRSVNDSSVMIAAQAWNEIYLGGGETDLVEITINDVKNDADIIITTAADDDGDIYGEGPVADNGDVLATDINGGENSGGGIDTEAYNNVYNRDTYQPIELTIEGPIENFSDTLINAGDDVMTVAIEDGDTEIDSEAWNYLGGDYGYMIDLIEQGPVRNLAGVDITAGQDVGVMSSYGSLANTGAWAANESSVLPEIFPDTKDNIATVNINAGGGVGVLAEYGSEAQIGAGAEFATTNTSTVTIEADGPVDVKAREDSQAGIMALSMTSIQRNTSNIEINADNVEVNGNAGSDAAISAEAYSAYEEESSENTAGVAIYTHLADVEPDEESGNVLVEASEGGGATIQAMTEDAYSNTSDVLVCADGDVQIYGMMGGDADILADAMNAYSNLAKIRVGARGDEGLIVRAENDGTAFVESWAQAGHTNTAETIVCTEGGVQIVDKSQVATSAGIIAEALNGYYTDAYVGICAEEDIMVMAGIGPEDLEEEIIEGIGGHAMIKAEASSVPAEEETTATAEVAVISHNGGVVVMEATNAVLPRTAEITSSASGGYTSTAYTGVSAGGDLLSEGHPLYEESQGTGVFVYGIGDYSHAKIVSETSGGYTNTSDTVVCTPADVVVEAEGQGSVAEIGSCAVDGYIHTATTQVYAGDVDVYIPGLYGEGGIWTYAQGVEIEPHVPYLGDSGNYDPVVGDYLQFILSEYDGDYGYQDLVWVEEEGEDTAQLLIRDYSERQDCPECPPCPCEEIPSPSVPAPPFVPPAPIPERITLEILGYPALMKWVAAELGVGEEKIQIWLANSLASATDIEPYQTYTRFRTAAIILQDSDGSHVAALAQVILELASDTTPPTEEQMASIADAIANNTGANNQYALAGIYLDALAVYIGFLTDEIGFSSEEAVQFVMNKYILPLAEGENAGVAVYVAARLAAQAPEGIEELEQGTTILDVLRARGII